ncbi:MAG: hypothetical protein LBU32_16370 [Clostridiales bacterium]|jgi:hypothetical protein|nr:hypothetical protein [Clostridiales bacterium]
MAGLSRCSNFKLLSLPDCTGLLDNEKCKWLNIDSCPGEGCSFFKSTDSLEKAQERLRSLDEQTQDRIAQKYYNGLRPWIRAAKSWG